ncbi:hypothetical protein D9M68_538630 [compost metagenome]
MAQPGERQVRAADPQLALGRIGQDALARDHRGMAVGIELDRHLRAAELDCMAVDDVAPQQQAVLARGEQVATVARRMPIGGQRAHASDRFGAIAAAAAAATAERAETVRRLVRRDRSACHREQPLCLLRRRGGIGFAEPVVGVGLVDMDRRVGKGRLSVHGEAAGMVAVQVGQQHGIDLFGRIARRAQVVADAPKRGAEACRRAGIDQHQAAAGIDEVGVDRGLHARRRLDEHPCQQALHLARAGVLEDLRVEVDVAVVQRGDFQLADHHAVVARHLRLLLRRGGMGGADRGRQHGGSHRGGQHHGRQAQGLVHDVAG